MSDALNSFYKSFEDVINKRQEAATMANEQIDALAYEFWAVHPKDLDRFEKANPMPHGYKGGMRAWFFACKMRELINTRPAAPVEGLETLSVEMKRDYAFMIADPDGDYVTRSQAEAIIAAERAMRKYAEERIIQSERELKEARANNAALTARVKELEQHSCDNGFCNTDHWYDKAKALETQLAAVRKALEPFALRADRYNDIPGLITTSDDVELWQLAKNKGLEVDITVGDLRHARAALEANP